MAVRVLVFLASPKRIIFLIIITYIIDIAYFAKRMCSEKRATGYNNSVKNVSTTKIIIKQIIRNKI